MIQPYTISNYVLLILFCVCSFPKFFFVTNSQFSPLVREITLRKDVGPDSVLATVSQKVHNPIIIFQPLAMERGHFVAGMSKGGQLEEEKANSPFFYERVQVTEDGKISSPVENKQEVSVINPHTEHVIIYTDKVVFLQFKLDFFFNFRFFFKF